MIVPSIFRSPDEILKTMQELGIEVKLQKLSKNALDVIWLDCVTLNRSGKVMADLVRSDCYFDSVTLSSKNDELQVDVLRTKFNKFQSARLSNNP